MGLRGRPRQKKHRVISRLTSPPLFYFTAFMIVRQIPPTPKKRDTPSAAGIVTRPERKSGTSSPTALASPHIFFVETRVVHMLPRITMNRSGSLPVSAHTPQTDPASQTPSPHPHPAQPHAPPQVLPKPHTKIPPP